VTVGTATGSVGISMLNSTGVADSDSQSGGQSAVHGVERATRSRRRCCRSTVLETSPTSATTVSWTVTFSKSVTGVKASNFSLTGRRNRSES
jgi:hypothetical protein